MGFSFVLLLLAVSAGIEENVHEHTLKNGLKVLVYVDSSAPVASVNAYYRLGSYDEQPGHTGLSHMLEHMSFKRTDIYRPGDFDRILDSAGAHNNGFTSTFFTGYFENFASDRWELGLRLEAARMGRCVFPDSEFESERRVVAEERRLRENDPGSVLWEQFESAALLANPQRNPTIGWSDDIRRFTVQDVRDWYVKYYNPANAVLVVAGDVDPEEVRAKAEQHFGRFKGKPVTRRDYYGIEPRQTGERRVVVRRKVLMPAMLVAFHSPGARDSLCYAGDVAAHVIGAGRSSRLHRRLVVEQGLATNVGAWNSVETDPGLFYIYVTPKAESLIPLIERAVEGEIERLGKEPPTDREMERVKNNVLAQAFYSRDDAAGIARFMARSHILFGDWRHFLIERERLAAVTKKEVIEFCRRFLVPDNRTTGLLLPEER